MDKEKKFSKDKCEIGFDGNPPEIMIITLPIKVWAKDTEDGMAMFYGKLREAQAVGAKTINIMRQKKAISGVVGANGKPMMVV